MVEGVRWLPFTGADKECSSERPANAEEFWGCHNAPGSTFKYLTYNSLRLNIVCHFFAKPERFLAFTK